MDLSTTILAIVRAIGFESQSLIGRTLQERGLSPLRTFRLQSYALILGIAWCFIFVHPSDISYILERPALLALMLLIPLVWNVSEFLFYYILNKTNSMSVLATLRSVILLPLLLVFGATFNNDTPSMLSVIAIFVLAFALVLQPTQHEQNKRTRYALPFVVLAGLVITQTVFETLHFGFMRAALQEIDPAVFLGIFSVLTLSLCIFWTNLYIRYSKNKEKTTLQKNNANTLFMVAIPVLWFIASITEMYAQAALPIYTLVAVGTLTFLMGVMADLLQRRIRFNLQTACFIGLVIFGIGLTIFAV